MSVNLRHPFAAVKPVLARGALRALHASSVHRFMPASIHGVGVIFMLHRVREPDGADFAPNRILEVAPDFLEATLHHVRERGLVTLSLDEAVERLAARDFSERFAVFTLDDGYKDNLTVAAPIFERYRVPFTVYLATSLPDGTAELWWVALERVIAMATDVRVRFPEGEEVFRTVSTADKKAAWTAIYWRLRGLGEDALRAEVRRLAAEHGLDMGAITRELAMSWRDVDNLAKRPYASVEAHTANHFALAQISEERARADIAQGIARHEAMLGRRPVHFSYPYGDASSAGERDFGLAREFGFRSATTTRKGLIHPGHADQPMNLPRLSLNGDYQDIRLLDVLMSGLPFAMAKQMGSAGIDRLP
ncbi:MAG: polysaccharide deacetylase family protein [Parvibaculum sp.]|uniref:polysaccharide deacetylase family protein n=1 Tax=Parvibaculum sp. TaxID=2024848 RepID=UPI0025EEC4DA|nr:polysaccharide deacetylase family protein [Parvibaculum sp.]MCE9649357.1 polysaccharide deacetylase family protein [Parvibaculum sp.]